MNVKNNGILMFFFAWLLILTALIIGFQEGSLKRDVEITQMASKNASDIIVLLEVTKTNQEALITTQKAVISIVKKTTE